MVKVTANELPRHHGSLLLEAEQRGALIPGRERGMQRTRRRRSSLLREGSQRTSWRYKGDRLPVYILDTTY